MIKKIISHSLLYSIAPVAVQVGSILLLPFLTPYLTATDFGIYGVITSYLFFITAIKDLGFSVVFVNTFYKYPRRWPLFWRLFYGYLLYWSLIYFVLLIGLLYIAIPKNQVQNFPIILLLTALPAMIFDMINLLGNYYYRFSERPAVITFVTLTGGVISLLVTYYCVVVLRLGYMSWFVANFSSAFVMFLCYVYPVFFKLKLIPILKIRMRLILPYLRVALPMIPHNYSSYLLNSSDRVIMNLMGIPIGQIGLYNVGYRFGNYFELAGEAAGMAVSPQYVRLYTENKEESLQQARSLSFVLMIFFLLAAFVGSLWLKEIFQILFRNPELQAAYSIGIIILMGYAYRPMYWSSLIRLSTTGNTNMLWRVSFVAGVLNVVLNLIFLKQYGIYAAAISTLISLIYVGFAGFYLQQYKRMNNLAHYPHFWIAAILVLTAAAYFLRDVNWKYKVVFTSCILLTSFIVTRTYFTKVRVEHAG